MTEEKQRIFMKIIVYVLFYEYFLVGIFGKSLSDIVKMTTPDKIREEGYKAETHWVVTADGYVIKMHRIPGKAGSTAVFLKHGFTSSSFDWVVTGKGKALAFILADNGYDVWLGNTRGNTYSRRHVKLEASNPQFWNFSFHEMAIYDVPAMITYITNLKNDKLMYIGHSLGATLAFVMATERPDIASRVKVILTMGPAVFLQHWRTPLRFLAQHLKQTMNFIKSAQLHELLPQNPSVSTFILKHICYELSEKNPCAQLIFFLNGYNPSQFNFTLLPLIFSHNPAGSSVNTLLHFLQMSRVGKFQQFDYGPMANQIKYNRSEPPQYDLSKIQLPIGIFWSDSDIFCRPIDIAKLHNAIPRLAASYKVPAATFTHVDFLLAIDAPTLVYSKLLSVLEDYKSSGDTFSTFYYTKNN